MLRGYVLRFLAAGAGGDTTGAGVPGFLRPVVRKAARRHVIAAGFETAHADDTAHVHRLAYLRAVSAVVLDPNDLEATRHTFEGARRPDLERRAAVAVVAPLVGLAVCGAAAAGTWAVLGGPDTAEHAVAGTVGAAPDADPAPTEPAHPLTPLFERAIPDYVIALDAASLGRERAAPHDVATARATVLEAVGDRPDLAAAMTRVLDASEGYVAGSSDHDDARWLQELVRLHDALEAADVPFYVDAELTRHLRTGRQRVLLSTYTIRGRRTFAAGGERVRCLDIERLDTLNIERSLLGYTRPEVRYALVVRDKIEGFLIETLLPSVHAAAESVIVRGYEDELGIEWVTSFEEWAHEDLAAENRALVTSSAPMRALAAAVVQRRNAIRDMNHALRPTGVQLREPLLYAYDGDALTELSAQIDASALGAFRSAEQTLRGGQVAGAYQTLVEAHSLSIAEHEVQHRLDYEADRLVAVPEVLAKYTGETESEDRVNQRAERANAELSAYLAQVARRPSRARTSLVHVASFAMNRNAWGMPEAYAAVALFEAMAREAGIAHEDLIARRRIVRGEVARIYGELRKLDPAEISALAGRAWTSLYGGELEPLRDVGPG